MEDARANSLRTQLYNGAIHGEIQKSCIKDYLQKDYYDAVFEAAKGLVERIKQITGLTTDGETLFQTAFSKNDLYLFLTVCRRIVKKVSLLGEKNYWSQFSTW